MSTPKVTTNIIDARSKFKQAADLADLGNASKYHLDVFDSSVYDYCETHKDIPLTEVVKVIQAWHDTTEHGITFAQLVLDSCTEVRTPINDCVLILCPPNNEGVEIYVHKIS